MEIRNIYPPAPPCEGPPRWEGFLLQVPSADGWNVRGTVFQVPSADCWYVRGTVWAPGMNILPPIGDLPRIPGLPQMATNTHPYPTLNTYPTKTAPWRQNGTNGLQNGV